MSKSFSYFVAAFILSGCVGSEVRVQDQEAMDRPFPQLQTVPDRPQDLGQEEREENLKELDHLAQDKWSLNQQLRDQYKLETDPCQK